MTTKIPATVITGFLGAGKTTLVRHILENANGRRIALVINEFGDIGVDGEIVRNCGDALCREDDLIELSNGCICCTVADDFIPTMEKLIGRATPPDHIVIETSGLALPQPLVRAFNWPEIKFRVTVDGVVTVVDGAAVAEGRFTADEGALSRQRAALPGIEHDDPVEELFGDQLNCADMVLLNKADLLDEARISSLKGDLQKKLRPGTKMIATEKGRIDVAALLGLGSGAEDDLDRRPSQHELEEGGHDHDDFESFAVTLQGPSEKEAILSRIRNAIGHHEILRLKGFLSIPGSQARMLVQAVGPRVDCYFDRPWRNDEARVGSLVVIGLKGLDRQAITAALTA